MCVQKGKMQTFMNSWGGTSDMVWKPTSTTTTTTGRRELKQTSVNLFIIIISLRQAADGGSFPLEKEERVCKVVREFI